MTSNTQRARERATDTRIRAFCVDPGKRYHVYSHGTRYLVFYNFTANEWTCLCPARTSPLCKHRIRVQDREERRIKQEELALVKQEEARE